MSIFTQYHPATGVVFDELDDLIATLTATDGGGGATATATATATPKATSTPTPGSRTAQIAGKWYVIDAAGAPISPPYGTKSEAMYAAQYVYPQATATPVPPTATPAPNQTAQAGGALDPGIYTQDLLAMADVGAGPTAAVQSGGAPAVGAPPPPPSPTTSSAPAGGTSRTGSATGGSTGSAGSSAAALPVPPEIASLMDTFEGFSDKDVVDAYYTGEITRDQLAALITARNTNAKGETKYTTASLERYLNQVDEAKPEPKRTMLDVLGERFGNIGREFNIKDPGFGGRGAFGSSTAGQGIMDKNLYTAQSGGEGLIPMSTPGGNTGLAATVVNNQLYPNLPATDQYLYSGSPASILQQSGVYVAPNTSPATQMQALGNLIALREFFMAQNPSLSPSQANELAVGTMQPANPNHDPSASGLASFAEQPPLMQQFARGGGMTLKEPVMGVGLHSRRPLFMAAEAGKEEKVQQWGNGLKFTPTNRNITMGRELPTQANQMAQQRAFGQQGATMRDGMPPVGIPVEGRENPRKPPSSSMLAMMRMLGIPGFAYGGTYTWGNSEPDDQDSGPTSGTRIGSDSINFGQWTLPSYTSPGLEGFTPDTFLNALQSDLQSRHADERQGELDAYKAALNDVAGIANVGRTQRQREAYDPRYAMAGLSKPVEVDAPLTGPMSALPPGVRYALASPATRQAQLSALNEQQRGIALSRLQSPSIQMLADLKEAIDDRDIRDIAELLGIPRDQVEDIIRATRELQGTDGGTGDGGTIGGGWLGGGGGF